VLAPAFDRRLASQQHVQSVPHYELTVD